MNVSSYNYSCMNALGNTLKQPWFKLVTNVAHSVRGTPYESRLYRIAKIALHCFTALLFIVPAGITWLIGKLVSLCSKTQIDYEGLSLAPPPILIPIDADPAINIYELYDKFNRIPLVDVDLASKRDCLWRLCYWVMTKNDEIYPDDGQKRNLFCGEMSILLRCIVARLNSGEVSANKEKDALMELAEASRRCYPTWLEVASRIFAEISGRAETVEVKLLRLVQEYKESIILEFAQNKLNAQWHALNSVRNMLGEELGLNTHLNKSDPYALQAAGRVFGKNVMKWLFMQMYENVNQFVSSIETMINSRSYDSSYHDFLVEIVRQNGVQNPEDFVAECLYDENNQLTFAGANLMLRSIGVLR